MARDLLMSTTHAQHIQESLSSSSTIIVDRGFIMYHTTSTPFAVKVNKATQTRRALAPIAILTLFFFGVSKLRPALSSIISPIPVTKPADRLQHEAEALKEQLKRIRGNEGWKALGDVQSTGEEIYHNPAQGDFLKEEANLAFFLQIAESNILLAPRLLSRIWHPGNIYCIHFDTKISPQLTTLFTHAVLSNPKLGNVFILPSAPVTYAGISMLINTLESIDALLKVSKTWDYYINLSGSDYPLISITGMRRLLGRPDLRNASTSFISYSMTRPNWDKYALHRLGKLHFDLALGFHHAQTEQLFETSIAHPILRDGNLRVTIAKGEAWVITHRTFCQRAVHGNIARRLLTLFANMQSSSEHFFQTLAWNHVQLNRTVARHSFREVLWTYGGRKAVQHPFYVDQRSEHGTWEMWPALSHSPNFFARKFRVPNSSLMDHIDIHKSGSTEMSANVTAVSESFGLVKNRFACVADIHAPKYKEHIMPCMWSGWRERGCRARQIELCVGDFAESPP